MARPVVATRVGGLPEVILHDRTGLLVEPENSQALADAVTVLLQNLPMLIQLGQTARNHAQQRFSWQQHVDSYDKLYRISRLWNDKSFWVGI